MKITNRKNNLKYTIPKNFISSAILFLLLAASLFIYRDSLGDILKGITKVSFSELAVSSLLAALFFIMEGSIIRKLAVSVNCEYKVRYGIATAYRCEFYRLITFGSGAGIAEIHCLHQNGIDPAVGTGISLLQFAMKKICVALLGITGFLLLFFFPNTKALCNEYIAFLITGCIITIAIVLFLLAIILSNDIMCVIFHLTDKFAARFPAAGSKAASLKDKVRLLNESGHIFLQKKRTLLWIVFLNLIKLTAVYCIPAYLLHQNCRLTVLQCAALMAAVYMLAGVIPAPSGIGSLEFVYLLIFGVFAAPDITVPSLLVFRFVTWILPFTIGGIFTLYDKSH